MKAPTEISRDGQQPLFVALHANCRAIAVICVTVHNDGKQQPDQLVL